MCSELGVLGCIHNKAILNYLDLDFRFRFRFNRLFFIVIMQLRLRKNICHKDKKNNFSFSHFSVDHKFTLCFHFE